jgi:hypothetical protein
VIRRGARGAFAIGVAVIAVYLLVAVVTSRDHHVRPLYDGFAPPEQYRWVDPPAFFAAGNRQPSSVHATLDLRPSGSRAAGVATPDGQALLDLGEGAVRAHAHDTHVAVSISPLAASGVSHPPAGLRANGNVYRVSMTYEPSGVVVAGPVRATTMQLVTPEVGTALAVASRPHGAWRVVPSSAVPPKNTAVTARLAEPGYYLDLTNLPQLVGPASSSASSSNAWWIAALTGAVVVALVVLGLVLARRRTRGARARQSVVR